jgi:pimeloyl-ACP methyl ester carboxylesterase
MIERKIDLGRCRMHVREAGRGPPVVLLHGLTFDSEMWNAQIDALSARYRVLAPDLRGHGLTEWQASTVTLHDLAGDVAHLLDRLNIENVACAGLSLGGMVAMRFALAHPKRLNALALLNTSAEAEEESKRDLYHQLNESTRGKESDHATVDFVLSLMFSEHFQKTDPEIVARFRKKLFEPSDHEGLYFVSRALIWRDDVLGRIAEIDLPTLVVLSDADAAVQSDRVEAIARAIPGARRLMLSGSGHLTPVERADEVSRALGEHFDLAEPVMSAGPVPRASAAPARMAGASPSKERGRPS